MSRRSPFLTAVIVAALIAIPPSSALAAGAVADLNGDGFGDVITRFADSDSAIAYLGNGTSGFANSRITDGAFSRADYAVAAPGFSGPSSPDLIIRDHADHSLRLFRASGGTLYGGWKIGSNWHTMDAIAAPGDFDGDGHGDLITRRSSDNTLWLFSGNGRGGFKASKQIGWNWHNMDVIFSAGDFSGDGQADILARHQHDHSLWLYEGNGQGAFASSRQIGWGWHNMNAIFSSGDFNGDGAPDVLARHNGDASLWLYEGNGRGAFKNGRQIGTNWSKLHLPGPWPSVASTPMPDPGPLPQPTQTRTQPFVYGTLRTGQRGYEMILKGKTTSEPKTTVSARSMYTKVGGAYPYSVPSSASSHIVGQEMWIRDADYWSVLARLDSYENYDPSKPLTNQAYYRTTHTTARGTKVWIYDATPRMADYLRRYGVKIPSGDWFNRTIPRMGGARTGPVADNSAVEFAVENISRSATCSNEFGTFNAERGEFVSIDVNVKFLGSEKADYLPVSPENLTVIDASGKPIVATSAAAVDCMAGSELPDAFIDAGATTRGTLVLDINPASLQGATASYSPLPGVNLSFELAPDMAADTAPAPTDEPAPDSEETDEG